METKLSQQVIGKRLMELRKQRDFSQEDLSKHSHLSRSSIAQIENGKRNLSTLELLKLSQILGFSIDNLLSENYSAAPAIQNYKVEICNSGSIRNSIPAFNSAKFRNVLLYILERCAGKPNVDETVTGKILYFVDFNYYEIYEEQLTGATYKKIMDVPVSDEFEPVLIQMIEKKEIQRIKIEYLNLPRKRLLPLIKADLTQLKASEKQVIDHVIEQLSDLSAKSISEYAQNDLPCKATKENETIDYELSFYRDIPYSVRNYESEEA